VEPGSHAAGGGGGGGSSADQLTGTGAAAATVRDAASIIAETTAFMLTTLALLPVNHLTPRELVPGTRRARCQNDAGSQVSSAKTRTVAAPP
jgi:hypothetical protein